MTSRNLEVFNTKILSRVLAHTHVTSDLPNYQLLFCTFASHKSLSEKINDN